MPEILQRRVVGDPILRTKAKQLTKQNITSSDVKAVVENMYYTLKKKQYGIALAAPQVGHALAIAIIDLKPTPTRPNLTACRMTLFNPKITEYIGEVVSLRDGCVSIGAEDDPIYGWSERYEGVGVEYQNQDGDKKVEKFHGFLAHVMQHEIDHLNGVLFIDRVKDSKTYTTASEYLKQQ